MYTFLSSFVISAAQARNSGVTEYGVMSVLDVGRIFGRISIIQFHLSFFGQTDECLCSFRSCSAYIFSTQVKEKKILK
jgi:hypothetical protein